MFEKPDPTFEPSSGVKEAILYLHKRPITMAGVRHPGYLGIHNQTVDCMLFVAGILFELAGFCIIYYLLSQNEVGSYIPTVSVAATLIVVDFMLALAHNKFSCGISLTLEIQGLIATRQKPDTQANIKIQNSQDLLRKRKKTASGISFFIIFLAAVKLFLIYILVSDIDSSLPTILFLAVLYFGTAIIHISATGYAIRFIVSDVLYRRDISIFKKSDGQRNKTEGAHIIELEEYDEFLVGVRVGDHQIKTVLSGGNIISVKKCLLICNGLLLDSEIESFANLILDKKARAEFVYKAMELQVRMVDPTKI